MATANHHHLVRAQTDLINIYLQLNQVHLATAVVKESSTALRSANMAALQQTTLYHYYCLARAEVALMNSQV